MTPKWHHKYRGPRTKRRGYVEIWWRNRDVLLFEEDKTQHTNLSVWITKLISYSKACEMYPKGDK